MASSEGVKVAKCPLDFEYCYPSCYWRRNNRCYYRGKKGKPIPELNK